MQQRKYEPTKYLKANMYGQIYQAINETTKEKVIVKQIQLSLTKKQEVNQQIEILNFLHNDRNPSLTDMVESFESNGQVILVFQYCHCMLYEILLPYISNDQLGEKQSYFIFWQILNAASALHSQGLMHSEIYFDNLMVQFKDDKVWDWYKNNQTLLEGMEKILKNSQIILMDFGIQTSQIKKQSSDSDIESELIQQIGVVFYCMLYNEKNFLSQDFKQNFNPDLESRRGILSDKTIEFVQKLINPDPKNRPNILQIYEYRQSLSFSNLGSRIRLKQSVKTQDSEEQSQGQNLSQSDQIQVQDVSKSSRQQSTVKGAQKVQQILPQDESDPQDQHPLGFESIQKFKSTPINQSDKQNTCYKVNSFQETQIFDQMDSTDQSVFEGFTSITQTSEKQKSNQLQPQQEYDDDWRRSTQLKLQKESPHLYEYCKSFYWTLTNFIQSYNMASTGVMSKNQSHMEDYSQAQRIGVARGLLDFGGQIGKQFPMVSNVVPLMNQMIDHIYSQVKNRRYEERLQAIINIVQNNDDIDIGTFEDLSRSIAISATLIAEGKKDIILERVSQGKQERPMPKGRVNKIISYFNESIAQIKERVGMGEIKHYQGIGGQIALEDVSLLLLYFQSHHRQIVEETKNKKFYQIIYEAVCRGQIEEVFNDCEESSSDQSTSFSQNSVIQGQHFLIENDETFWQGQVSKCQIF